MSASKRTPLILKWAGGKTKLIPQLVQLLPEHMDTYVEPFLGGGALLFELARTQQFTRAWAGDINPELIGVYRTVRDSPSELIHKLLQISNEYQMSRMREAYYYRVRTAYNERRLELLRKLVMPSRISIDQAARFIFLNRTGFNGLYRENRAGEFNVPHGRYANSDIVRADVIRARSRNLGHVQLECESFHSQVHARLPIAVTGVYCDPPYLPAQAGGHTKYTQHGFTEADHAQLAHWGSAYAKMGARVLISSSDTPRARQIYASFAEEVHEVSMSRSINRDGGRRGAVGELIFAAGPL